MGAINLLPLQKPSPSTSFSASSGHKSQASPMPSLSESDWLAFEIVIHLSTLSNMLSLSESNIFLVSQASPIPSPLVSV